MLVRRFSTTSRPPSAAKVLAGPATAQGRPQLDIMTAVSTIQVLQIAITALVIAFYALYNAMQESDARTRSRIQIVLYAAFLFAHDEASNWDVLTEIDEKSGKDENYEAYWVSEELKYYQDHGSFLRKPVAGLIQDHVLLVLFPPIIGFVLLVFNIIQHRAYRLDRIIATDVRRNLISKDIVVLGLDIVYLACVVQFLAPHVRWLAYTLGILLCLGLISSISDMSLWVWSQARWKNYWENRFLDIMGVAANKSDHDLFNRALLLRTDVVKEPSIPFPGAFAFYLGVYSVVQAALIWIQQNII